MDANQIIDLFSSNELHIELIASEEFPISDRPMVKVHYNKTTNKVLHVSIDYSDQFVIEIAFDSDFGIPEKLLKFIAKHKRKLASSNLSIYIYDNYYKLYTSNNSKQIIKYNDAEKLFDEILGYLECIVIQESI